MIEEFNLVNTVTEKSLNFNMTTGPIWLESLNIGPIKGIDQLYSTPGQDGEQLALTYLSTRSVTITAWVVNGEIPLNQQKDELNKFCNPKQPLDIYVNNYKLNFVPGSSIQYSKKPKENNSVMCKFVIMGEAYVPFWTSQEEIESLVSYVQPLWVLPFAIPSDGIMFSVNQPTASTQINNLDLPVGCRVTFVANGGSVSTPGIICAETQEQLTINSSLSNGEKVVIDTRLGHRRVTKFDAQNNPSNWMKYLSYSSDWITLQTGLNTFSFFATSGSEFLETSIMYSPLLLEVEQ